MDNINLFKFVLELHEKFNRDDFCKILRVLDLIKESKDERAITTLGSKMLEYYDCITNIRITQKEEKDYDKLIEFYDSIKSTLGANLSALTGTSSYVKQVQISNNPHNFLHNTNYVLIQSNYSCAYKGERFFLLSHQTANFIVTLLTKEISELDEMSLSVLSEIISQVVGIQITELVRKTQNKSIAADSPNAIKIKKEAITLAVKDVIIEYTLNINGTVCHLYEIMEDKIANSISNDLGD